MAHVPRASCVMIAFLLASGLARSEDVAISACEKGVKAVLTVLPAWERISASVDNQAASIEIEATGLLGKKFRKTATCEFAFEKSAGVAGGSFKLDKVQLSDGPSFDARLIAASGLLKRDVLTVAEAKTEMKPPP